MKNKNEKTSANNNAAANSRQQSTRSWLMMLGLLLAVFFGQAMTANAATYTVDNTSDDATKTACTTAADDCSLRGAINNANASPEADTIDFDLSGCPCTITLTGGELVIADNGALTTINGPGADQLSVSGNNQSRVFFIQSNAAISGITITGGNSPGNGGGIFNNGTLTINNSTISGNRTRDDGNEVSISGGDANCRGGIGGTSTFTVGNGSDGGGIFNAGSLNLSSSTISGNQTGSGGNGTAIAGDGNDEGSQCQPPLTPGRGGDATAIAGNGGDGAGTYSLGILVVDSSTVSDNSTGTPGTTSAIDGSDGPNGSIGGNATAVDGSMGRASIYVSDGTASLNNTIVANTGASTFGPDIFGSIAARYSLIKNPTESTITGQDNIVGQDPLLGPLADNGGSTFTHALMPGSAAVDAGDTALTADQRGFTRPVDHPASPNGSGNISDIGSFELQIPDSDGDGIPDNCDIDSNPGAVDFDRDGIVDSSECDTEIGPPVDKDQCKNGGWMRLDFPRKFKNQGDCVSSVNTGK